MRKTKHTQEIFFDNGTRRVVANVVKIIRGTWWHLYTEDKREIIVNPDRVLFVQIHDKP